MAVMIENSFFFSIFLRFSRKCRSLKTRKLNFLADKLRSISVTYLLQCFSAVELDIVNAKNSRFYETLNSDASLIMHFSSQGRHTTQKQPYFAESTTFPWQQTNKLISRVNIENICQKR